MNINKTQLSVSLRDKMDDTMPLVVRALTDAAEHQRGACVTIKIKVKHDKKESRHDKPDCVGQVQVA